MHVHKWKSWTLRILFFVSFSESKKISYNIYRLQVVGEGASGSVLHCNWVHRYVVDTAFHLA
jgi:hypothetical protein